MKFARASGVLLHVTSLPGPHGSGDFGPAAYHFVDWLEAGGQTLWQILPLGGIGLGNSPYMSSSAFAGNVLLVSLDELQARGWLEADDLQCDGRFDNQRINFDAVIAWRMERLARAAARFLESPDLRDAEDFSAFCRVHAHWLDDYALFMAIAEMSGGQLWCDWEPMLAGRDEQALRQAGVQHAQRIAFWKFCQWRFFRQWSQLKAYANAKGVWIVGDMPIFIAHQSADVWARPDLFELDAAGQPTVVAGVPPDDFSATGQRWGNPLYRWPAHAADQYQWWIDRIRSTFELVDIVRIDHFRGFESYWEIPADEPTAMHGRWVLAPGDELFHAVTAALGSLPVIAEDLGVITPEVDALRKRHAFPGMQVLQFAWSTDGVGQSRYLPHNHAADSVVYGGTHDNNTARGWWETAPEGLRHHLRDYLATDGHEVSWDLIRAAFSSVADLAIHPMQDVLRLSGDHRMNIPGVPNGNWGWRFTWSQVDPSHAAQLRRMCALYGRVPGRELHRS
jgi:4-alpha-glucanotransferase